MKSRAGKVAERRPWGSLVRRTWFEAGRGLFKLLSMKR